MKADPTANLAAGVIVRRMQTGDLDRVMAIAASLHEAPHWPQSAYISVLDPRATPQRIALVAEEPETGTIIGFAAASLIPPQAELETIAVASGVQRRGIGARLLFILIDEMRAAAASEFILEVRASNQAALRLYRSQGFTEAGRRKRYYTDPEEDAVLMNLVLG